MEQNRKWSKPQRKWSKTAPRFRLSPESNRQTVTFTGTFEFRSSPQSFMSSDNTPFNPYHKLLGIPAEFTSPDHYTLLGITMFESDVEVITNAADARMMFLRSFQTGKHAEVVQKLLNEVSAARVCLLNETQRKAYDAKLRAERAQASGAEIPPISTASTNTADANGLTGSGASTPVSNSRLPIPPVQPPPVQAPSTQAFGAAPSSRVPTRSVPAPPVPAPPVQAPPVVGGTMPQIEPDLFEIDATAGDSADSASNSGIQRGSKAKSSRNAEKKANGKGASVTYRPVKRRWLFLWVLLGCVLIAVGVAGFTGVLQKWVRRTVAEIVPDESQSKAEPKPSPEETAAFEAAKHSLLDSGVERQPGQQVRIKLHGVEYAFRWCPPGNFQMGSPKNERGRNADFETQHSVTLTSGFWMLETEVTQTMWLDLMEKNPSPRRFQYPNAPIVNVRWEDAQAWCKKLSKHLGYPVQLPTEAQWEYACRAGKEGNLLQESNPDEWAWYRVPKEQNGLSQRLRQVAGKKPNAWGLYDMHGNAAEWCRDWFKPFDGNSQTDPEGPAEPDSVIGAQHVVRGGSFSQPLKECRSAYRASQQEPSENLGFRVIVVPNK